MTDARLFQWLNLAPMPGWALLGIALFVPSVRPWAWTVAGVWLPAALAVAYGALVIARRDPVRGSFFSFDGVRSLFASPRVLLAGWTHFLAFDLFVGTWIARTGVEANVHPLILAPLLGLTLMLGPLGYLGAVVVFAVTGAL
ncbi:MAG: ABA4-like family protein [Myxococcota bacterium]